MGFGNGNFQNVLFSSVNTSFFKESQSAPRGVPGRVFRENLGPRGGPGGARGPRATSRGGARGPFGGNPLSRGGPAGGPGEAFFFQGPRLLNRGAPKTAKNHCVLLYFRHWGVLRKSSRRDRRAPSNRDGTRGSRGVAGWGPRGPGGGPGAAGGGPGGPRAHRGGARGRKRSLGGSLGDLGESLGPSKRFS